MENDISHVVGTRLGSIDDLPEALKLQLSVKNLDDLESRVLSTIRTRFQGMANLDEIIVGLYRDFGYVTEDRRMLGNKLYRMTKAGLVESQPGRKGVYKAL